MFEGLKKKFSSFVDSLSKKETEKEYAQQEHKPEQEPEEPKSVRREAPSEPTKEETVGDKQGFRKHSPEKPDPQPETRVAPEIRYENVSIPAQHQTGAESINKEPEKRIHEEQKIQKQAAVPEVAKAIQAAPPVTEPHSKVTKTVHVLQSGREEHVQHNAPKITTTTRIKGFIFGHVEISENDANPFIEELKVGLLQSDVNYDVAERVTENIRSSLVGRKVDSRNIGGEIRQCIRNSILGVLSKSPEVDLIALINREIEGGEVPFKILFLGPNGAGKTTTMAKVASMLISKGISCVLSASDTFRAAAIEQTVYHSSKLGINVIKGTYGADPASVAFDAIAHAKAHGITAVLIDSAGRQETNKSLIEELRKMVRVAKPNLKVFVGESISGNSLLEQVKALNQAVGLDGIILTKLDVDAKGGNTLSILSDTTVPILFFGTGEKYTDIMKYDPRFIVDSMLPDG